MNLTSYISEASSQFSHTPVSSYPGLVWSYYLSYLWNYERDSWVARIANASRILAFLLCLPTLILALVDVSAYVIARTLGVVDDVKASTSDKVTQVQTPFIRVEGSDAADGTPEGEVSAPQHPKEFFATDNNLKLSGVDILSPAATRPSSPVLARRKLSDVDTTLRQRQQPLTTINDD
ncbi:hypothetical protein DFP72DRAFT_523777 [Ephemerocybe angulata]|uniref:Transmembrane protein n=1 Tax=Ephemerocybe angulata TaxID=980116 RepID=A0A8H6ICM6_9AGAR|nr:hypothetical protein DFP72DRAFT_523777 [Tulosesus angulatus]